MILNILKVKTKAKILEEMAEELGLPYYETSAATGEGSDALITNMN